MTTRRTHLLEVPLHARSDPPMVRYCLLAQSIHVVSARSLCCCLIERECRRCRCERGDDADADHSCSHGGPVLTSHAIEHTQQRSKRRVRTIGLFQNESICLGAGRGWWAGWKRAASLFGSRVPEPLACVFVKDRTSRRGIPQPPVPGVQV